MDNDNNRIENITFKDYVSITIVNCGIKKTIINPIKIDEYYNQVIKNIVKKYNVDIDLINLIESKIIITKHNKYFINNNNKNKIKFENTVVKLNDLQLSCSSESFIKLNNQIKQIVTFCNNCKYDKYNKYQFNKNTDKIICEIYDELKDLKISEDSIKFLRLNLNDVYALISKKIDKKYIDYYDIICIGFSLKENEYNILKQNVYEIKIIEEEIFNKRMELIIQEKSNEITSRYDKLIKNVIESNEKKCNELNNIIKELKDNSDKATHELLDILENNDKIKQNNTELEDNIIELLEKNQKLEKQIEEYEQNKIKEVQFIENIIKNSSISDSKEQLDI